ncbi:MAG TPA: hypothetical protein VHW26_13710 [Solirubrobacteraceae bacterium]|nr:hypothetical protein [Solirubrobacteraceae bacterium]
MEAELGIIETAFSFGSGSPADAGEGTGRGWSDATRPRLPAGLEPSRLRAGLP